MKIHNTMTQSTPLDKIESGEIPETGGSDSERVQRIIQEMNRGDTESPGEPEPMYQQMPSQQMGRQMGQQMGPPMSHPSMDQQMGPPMSQQMGHQPMGQQMEYHMYQQPHMMPPQQLMGHGMTPYPEQEREVREVREVREEKVIPPVPAKKNMWAHITDTLKIPFVVACVFFILTLPIVDLYLSKQAHWAFSSGGQLSIPGIALKAVVAGSLIGLYDTVDNLISRFL
jgi:hypothetical protein